MVVVTGSGRRLKAWHAQSCFKTEVCTQTSTSTKTSKGSWQKLVETSASVLPGGLAAACGP